MTHDWVYLLNSDMRVHPIRCELLPPVAVRIRRDHRSFMDPERRRGRPVGPRRDSRRSNRYVQREPENHRSRAQPVSGGGSSLCRTRVLRRYVRATERYRPFYFEDAEWGIRAWQDGWEVLFVPCSHVWHHHRATVARFYPPDEIERVFARNALQFELRHGLSPASPPTLLAKVTATDSTTRSELEGIGTAAAVFAARYATRCAQRHGFDFTRLARDKFYGAPRPCNGPRVLIVSPFALFPPAHGGARRLAELTQRLSTEAELILLSDERSLYDTNAEPWFVYFSAVPSRDAATSPMMPPPTWRLVSAAMRIGACAAKSSGSSPHTIRISCRSNTWSLRRWPSAGEVARAGSCRCTMSTSAATPKILLRTACSTTCCAAMTP